MTDRELLESAAKAAGLTPDVGVNIKTGHLMVTREGVKQPFFWNPLTDDGDAFRLAVRLRLHVDHNSDSVTAWVMPNYSCSGTAEAYREHDNGNPLAATRRAIVRAAAEIGRSKE